MHGAEEQSSKGDVVHRAGLARFLVVCLWWSVSAAGGVHAAARKTQLPPEAPPKADAFHFFSVLHDAVHGDVRIIAEAQSEPVCRSVHTCDIQQAGGTGSLVVTAQDHHFQEPVWDPRQLGECFIWCRVPAAGARLSTVTLSSLDGVVMGTQPVEEVAVLPPGKEMGVGVCSGPIVSNLPMAADWVDYYSGAGPVHALQGLGVGGIHLYAAVSPWLLDADYQIKLEQPTAVHQLLQFRHRHLVTWMQYHPPSKNGSHFFGQRLMMNDCVFRHRNVYEFIVMPDQDEFLSFPTIDTQQPDIRQVFRGIFKDDNSAAALYFSAMYHVHCYMAEAPALGPHNLRAREAAPSRYPTYSGYNVWNDTDTEPDWTKCRAIGDCLPKFVVRPMAADVVGIHHMLKSRPGYGWGKLASPDQVFTKHVRCLMRGHEWEPDRDAPLCTKDELLHPEYTGWPIVCPGALIRQASSVVRQQ